MAIHPDLLGEFTLRFARYSRWPHEISQYWIHCIGFGPTQLASLKKLETRTLKGLPIRVTFDDQIAVSSNEHPEVMLFAKPEVLRDNKWCSQEFKALYILLNETDVDIPCEYVMLELIIEDKKPVFDVHLLPANGANISISARMLRLAREIND